MCDSSLEVIGSRKRTLIQADGDSVTLIIRRLRCRKEGCRRIHHELPDILVPYKRHAAETIEQVIAAPAEEAKQLYYCEASTVYHIKVWFSLLREYLESSIQALKELHTSDADIYEQLCRLIPLDEAVMRTDGWLRRIVRVLVNSGRWVTYPIGICCPLKS